MATNKRKTNKKKEIEEKKIANGEPTKAEKDKAKREAAEKLAKEEVAKKAAEEKAAQEQEKLDKCTKYKCIIATLAALCFAFFAGIGYNWYCSNGHIFDDDVEYLEEVETRWHAFNGRYIRLKADSAYKWYSGVETDEVTGEVKMTGKKASCLVWLNTSNFISVTVNTQKEFDELNEVVKSSEEYMGYVDHDTGLLTDALAAEQVETKSTYIEGQIKRPSSVELKKYKDAFADLMAEWEFTVDDYYMYDLTIDTSGNKSIVKVTTIVYAVFAIIFLIATIVAGVKYHNYKKINGIKIVRE